MSAIKSVSSSSSSAAAAAALGKSTFSDHLRSLVQRIAAVVIAVFHYIQEKFTQTSSSPLTAQQVTLASAKDLSAEEIRRLMNKLGKQPDFDIETELKTEQANVNPVLADPNKKPWMFLQFYKDLIQRNHQLLTITSKDGSILFNKTQGPEGVIQAFDKLFSQDQKLRDLVQVFCMQNVQVPFCIPLAQIAQGVIPRQKEITLTQESDDRFRLSYVYDVQAVIEGQPQPIGVYELSSTLHRSNGSWTVSQEIRKPSLPASFSTLQLPPGSRGWIGAALAVAAVSLALGLYTLSRYK